MAPLELGAAGPGWSPWKRKGAKAVKKAEAGTNEFPFRNCSSVIATSLIAQRGFYLQSLQKYQ